MKMKKLTAVLMAATMGLTIYGCGSAAPAEAPAEAPAATESEAPAAEAPAAETTEAAGPVEGADADYAKVREKGKLVVGITDFEPMDYKDEAGNWIGFDADMATEFAHSLDVEVEFVEIDWDNKVLELNSGAIDCVWNGMTLTDEVTSAMVVIVPADKADQYQTVESLKDLNFAVEAGSAGAAEAQNNGLKYTEVQSQAAALMEVKGGTSDAAIIDSLMAAAMVGEGTSYEDLTYTIGLNSEEYGVGFRKGSDLVPLLNKYFQVASTDGTLMNLAEKYGVQAAVIEQK